MRNLKKWRKYIIPLAVIVFIGCNLFLLLKENSKAVRTVNIDEWTFIHKGNIKKLLFTKGITEPENETHVYFDHQKGSLGTILVKEGDLVKNGTPLFSYDSQKLDDQKASLEDEAKRLQGEIDSIDQEISQLQQIDTSASSDTKSVTGNNKKVDVHVDLSAIAKSNTEQKIAEAQAEKGKLEAALTTNEDKITRVEKQLADLNVVSTIDGQVVNIHPNLKDPMMTIASTNSVVKATASAKQVQQLVNGQQVKLYSKLTDQTYNGTVSQVITYPNKVKKEPMYSFLVKFNEEAINKAESEKKTKKANLSATMKDGQKTEVQMTNKEIAGKDQAGNATETQKQESQMAPVQEKKPLLVGTNMKLQVTVDEVTAVPILFSKSIWNSGNRHYVYQLTSNGLIQKQEVALGVAYQEKNQIVKGLQANDAIVTDNDAISQASSSNFITPLKTIHIQKAAISTMSFKQHTKYILMGLFE